MWTLEERKAALELPYGLRNAKYSRKDDWLSNQRFVLGFPEKPLWFSAAKKGAVTYWVVYDHDALYSRQDDPNPEDGERGWLLRGVQLYESAIRFEDTAASPLSHGPLLAKPSVPIAWT